MFMFCRNIENFKICYCPSVTEFSDTKKSFMMKKKRKKKRTFRIWGKGHTPRNLQTRTYLEKEYFYGFWDLWSTDTLKIIGHENSQEDTCIAPTGWAHFIQPINFIEKITESWWKDLYSERKAKPNNTKFTWKNWWSQRRVMSLFRITLTNAFKPIASTKKWTLKTQSFCWKPMFKHRKLQQKNGKESQRG